MDMQPDVTLLLVRHGQSTWNAEGRWQGQADPPLSELGRQQATTASERIGTVDAVVSSTQQRALETALIIAAAIGVGPVLTDDGMVERNAGPWSGLTKTEIERDYPGFLAEDRRPDGYETDASLLERNLAALDRIANNQVPAATVLVATHGGVIHNLEAHLGLEVGRVPNLSGRVIERRSGEWRPGEQLTLLDDDLLTGGDPNRV